MVGAVVVVMVDDSRLVGCSGGTCGDRLLSGFSHFLCGSLPLRSLSLCGRLLLRGRLLHCRLLCGRGSRRLGW